MNKKIILATLAAAMLPAFAMAADVTGVWVRDAKSDPRPDTMYWLVRTPPPTGGGGNQEFVLTVKQDAGKLTVFNPNLKFRTVILDGKAHVEKTDSLIANQTVTAANSANAVEITTTQPFGGMPGNAPLTIKESWSVSPDGKVLTVTTTRSLPARTSTDRQIYNRRS
jgi:hypothetical protein